MEKKWIDHREIDIIPIEIYVLFLKCNINPTVRPNNKVIKIVFLNLLGKNNIFSGFIIHNNIEPNKIAIGLM